MNKAHNEDIDVKGDVDGGDKAIWNPKLVVLFDSLLPEYVAGISAFMLIL